MPSVWSWYQSVVARWSFGYWKIAVPGCHDWPQRASNFCLKYS